MLNRFFNNVIDLFSGSKAKASDIEAHFNLITTGFDGVQAEIDLKSPLNSPVFTGMPTAPTAAPGVATQQLATTAFATAIGVSMLAAGATSTTNAAATAADRVQTGLDRTQTVADRVQTGLDRAASAQAVVDAAGLLDQFDDRYLGVKAADPTLDNDGNALVAGAIYVSSVSGFLRAFTGSAWVQGISSISGVASVNGLAGAVTVQPTLVSGTNIKTVGGASLMGSGDVAFGLVVFGVSTTTQTAAAGSHYVLTNAAATTVTLPAQFEGATVAVTATGTQIANVIAPNGADTIMGLAEPMTIDKANTTVTLRSLNNSWRII